MIELKADTWYWVSDPNEGDIFYPVLGVDESHVVMDSKAYHVKNLSGLIVTKAVMPGEDN